MHLITETETEAEIRSISKSADLRLALSAQLEFCRSFHDDDDDDDDFADLLADLSSISLQCSPRILPATASIFIQPDHELLRAPVYIAYYRPHYATCPSVLRPSVCLSHGLVAR